MECLLLALDVALVRNTCKVQISVDCDHLNLFFFYMRIIHSRFLAYSLSHVRPYLIPWPGPQNMPVTRTNIEPVTMDIQSSPALTQKEQAKQKINQYFV